MLTILWVLVQYCCTEVKLLLVERFNCFSGRVLE